MRSKHSMVSATATPSRAPVTEIYIGGAGDTRTRLVAAFAEARQRLLAHTPRDVHYFPHYAARRALHLASRHSEAGRAVVLTGHSWGCDTVLRVAAKLPRKAALIICADPVSKSRLNPPPRPRNAEHVIVLDARPSHPNRSDAVKNFGHLFGGTLQRTLADAHTRIVVNLNHFAFAEMMVLESDEGISALGLINRLNRNPAASSSLASPGRAG